MELPSINYCSVAYTDYEGDFRVRRYAEALVNNKNRIDAFVLKNKKNKQNNTLNGVNIYYVANRNFKENSRFSYFFNILNFFFRGILPILINHVRYRYDVIHIHNVPDFLVFMAIIPKICGAQIILDIHDILPEFYCQKFGKPFDSVLAKVLLCVERLSVKFADHIIAANDLWREKIIIRHKIPPEKITAMLNYPNLAFFKGISNNPQKGKLNLIYPGTISHLHGVDILIEALRIVKDEIPFVRLSIYGFGNINNRNDIENLIKELNLCDNVLLLQPVGVEELHKIYNNVDIGIVPKRKGLFSSEAFSTKIFDFMSAGIPVIASKTKIDQYYFNNSMITFFESGNPESLAKKIINLENDPGRRRSQIVAAKKYVDKNNWSIKMHIFYRIIITLKKAKLN